MNQLLDTNVILYFLAGKLHLEEKNYFVSIGVNRFAHFAVSKLMDSSFCLLIFLSQSIARFVVKGVEVYRLGDVET